MPSHHGLALLRRVESRILARKRLRSFPLFPDLVNLLQRSSRKTRSRRADEVRVRKPAHSTRHIRVASQRALWVPVGNVMAMIRFSDSYHRSIALRIVRRSSGADARRLSQIVRAINRS